MRFIWIIVIFCPKRIGVKVIQFTNTNDKTHISLLWKYTYIYWCWSFYFSEWKSKSMDMLLKPNSLLTSVQASNWLGEIGERGYYFGYTLVMFKN